MRFFLIYNTVAGLRSFRLEQPTITVGALPSNHLVLAGKDVDPIHCLIEKQPDGGWRISDLGSEYGVYIGGKKIDVEADLSDGDKLQIGSVELHFEKNIKVADDADPSAARGAIMGDKSGAGLQKSPPVPMQAPRLFEVKSDDAPSGKILEIIAFWGDRVLEIEHYHKPSAQRKTKKKLQTVATIGMSDKADFMAAGPKKISLFTIARTTESGYSIKLVDGMEARLRRSGKIKKVGAGKFKLSNKDIADVRYGPIRYFMLYVTPPRLKLPKHSPRDPLFLALIYMGTALFLLVAVMVNVITPSERDRFKEDDIWSIVGLTQEVRQPKKAKKKPVTLKDKPIENKKPVIPQVKPKPKPKPNPKTVAAKEKPEKVIKKPKTVSQLNQLKPPPTPSPPSGVKKPTPAPPAKTPAVASSRAGAGKKGAPGGGGVNTLRGGSYRTGAKTKRGAAGVEGVSNQKASGVNLSQLGMGAGKIFNKAGAGAIQTNFKSSAGGLGGGSGSSGSRTHGLGGSLTQSSAVGLEGSRNQINTFGSGSGGLIGSGTGKGFAASGSGRSAVTVNVSAGGPPGVSGGLNQSEVSAVMRTNNNQIRNCYEKTLKRNPRAVGKVKIQMIVGANGRIISLSQMQNTVGDSALVDCIISRIRTWSFPLPRGGQKVTVNYPWVFRPS